MESKPYIDCARPGEWTIAIDRYERKVLLRAAMFFGSERVEVSMEATPEQAENVGRLLLAHASDARRFG
jgi:hypothetical protein